MHRDRFEALGVVGFAGCAVEVIPDRDPAVAEFLDTSPRSANVVTGDVLQTRVNPENRHGDQP